MDKRLNSPEKNASKRGLERRSGSDRRQREGRSPTGYERRRQVEQRAIEVVELFLSREAIELLKEKWRH